MQKLIEIFQEGAQQHKKDNPTEEAVEKQTEEKDLSLREKLQRWKDVLASIHISDIDWSEENWMEFLKEYNDLVDHINTDGGNEQKLASVEDARVMFKKSPNLESLRKQIL
jgi:hypothetical protein